MLTDRATIKKDNFILIRYLDKIGHKNDRKGSSSHYSIFLVDIKNIQNR